MTRKQDQKPVYASERVQVGEHSFDDTAEGRIEALCLFIAEVKSLYSNLNKVRLNMSALCGEVPSIVSLEEIDVNKRTIDAAREEIYKQLTELEAERDRLMAIEKGYLGDDEDDTAIEWS
jgi:hypothetical protein